MRGTANVADKRQRTVRFKQDIEPLQAGAHVAIFRNVPASTVIWRVGVTATPAGNPLADIHALDNEAGPCE